MPPFGRESIAELEDVLEEGRESLVKRECKSGR